MPFNGSGTFTIVNTFVPNTTILSSAVNQNFTDIATGLSDCLTRDGQAGMTAAFGAISGSIGAPSITFNSDATSGLYLSATGVPALVSHSLGLFLNTEVYRAQSATVQAGGSNYAVGDTIYVTNGVSNAPAVFTVATLSGSAVATVTRTVSGIYLSAPSNPVAQVSTSGSGSGCTLNITWNNPSGADYRPAFLTEANALLWTNIGASSFVSGLMGKANGLDFATAIGSSNLVNVISGSFLLPPQGILSPVSSTSAPIPTSDQTAVTRIYWTPYSGGNGCPIYNGVSFVNTTSSQIFADLTSGAQVSGGIYDVYKFLNSGTVTLGFSPSWVAGTSGSVTAGSCARGTGTGGTALTWLAGIPTNAVAMTLNNGATTYSIAINQATYLGSIYVNSTAGQINCYRSYGQSRVWGLWNSWNRNLIELAVGDSTASWTLNSTTWRQSRAQSTNFGMAFTGLAEEPVHASFIQSVSASVNNNGATTNIGIGVNSTSSPSGNQGSFALSESTAGSGTANAVAALSLAPALGLNQLNTLEQSTSGTNGTFSGTQTSMQMLVSWRA